MTWDCRWLLLAICAVVLAPSGPAPAPAAEDPREIWVNGLRLDADQVMLMEDVVGVRLRSGAYIYDPESGKLRAVGMSATPKPPPAAKDSAA